MKPRTVRGVTILVAVLLLGSVLQPAALATPYSESNRSYAIAHESTEAFTTTVEGTEGLDASDPTPVSALSPETRSVFEQAGARPPSDDGWQRLGSVLVCDESLLVCDEYEAEPDVPADAKEEYGEGVTSYSVVEHEDELYLLRAGGGLGFDFSGPFESLLKLVVFGPYVAFLALAARYRGSSRPRQTLAFAGFGGVLVAIAFSYPYVLMFTGASPSLWHIGLFVATGWTPTVYGTRRIAGRTTSKNGAAGE